MAYFCTVCASLLAVVFACSAYSKVNSSTALRQFVASVPVPDPTMRRALGLLVVAAEMALPPVLLLPSTRRFGFLAASVLMAALTVHVAAVVRTGVATPCRCFGAVETPIGRIHVFRNLTLTLTALASFVTPRVSDPVTATAWLLCTLASLTLAVLMIVGPEIITLASGLLLAPKPQSE